MRDAPFSFSFVKERCCENVQSHSGDTKAKFCEGLSNDEMWSLPCFIYPDCQIRLLRHFYAPQGAFSCRFLRLFSCE